MPSIFLLQGAVVPQNEHVEPQWAGDSLIQYIQTQTVPLLVLLIFLTSRVPQTGRWGTT